ncbi:uncharacterized protein LOC113208726 [Frankliniella occidentalis]|uniref:Uncharacterized protein LOC113208726 n=1 Tax=Frankliniella occidentalis TaxID=133901 RepID=A0A9C6XU22_FRAOC|nr:uncharacterized protein LOC113208726 [Frankliniella occidentalis]
MDILLDDEDGLGGQNLVWTADENDDDNVWASVMEVPGQKKESVLFLDEDTSYVYRAKTKKWEYNRRYLKCRKRHCYAKAVLKRANGLQYICQTSSHHHLPEKSFLEANQFRQILYKRARNECTALSEIHRQELAKIEDEHVIAKMTYARLQSSMQRQRNVVYPPLPKTLAEFCLSLDEPQYAERFGKTRDGKRYFRTWRTGSALEGTVAIFVSEHFEPMLSTSHCFQIDGHFKMSPNISDVYQQVTIMPVSYDHVFPAVTILMTRKTKAAYKMAFQCLKEEVPTINMPHIMSDFEKGLLGALREEFPAAHLTGCLFHLDQAMCKKASKIGLRPLLNEDDPAGKARGKVVRMCMALPFLPAEKIDEGFRAVRDHSRIQNYNELEPFLDYVERTWLQGKTIQEKLYYLH